MHNCNHKFVCIIVSLSIHLKYVIYNFFYLKYLGIHRILNWLFMMFLYHSNVFLLLCMYVLYYKLFKIYQ